MAIFVMTRLMENKNSNGEPEGYHPSIFDYDGSHSMKRSRPYRSSLDYKLGSGNPGRYVFPPQPMSTGRMSPNEEHLQQQQQQAARKVMTRARTSSGIPPQQLTLEDLQNLDEESLMRVLYENPHLAQEAERLRQQHSPRGDGTSSSKNKMMSSSSRMMDRKYHRRADGTVRTGENSYIEDLRKDGFPVVQWVIVLLLIGGLAYQLHKSLKGPDKTKKSKKGKGSNNEKKIDSELDRLAEEVGPSVKTKNSAAPIKKKAPKKKPAKAKAPAPAPDSTNGKTKKKKETFDPAVPALTVSEPQVDQGEWQVVGKATEKKKNAEDKEDKDTKADASTEPIVPVNGSKSDGLKSSTETDEETLTNTNGSSNNDKDATDKEIESTPVADSKEDVAVSGKKKSRKKKKNSSTSKSSAPSASATEAAAASATEAPLNAEKVAEDDAALAKQLQKEEENLAAAAVGTREDTWEEVVVKKRRSKA